LKFPILNIRETVLSKQLSEKLTEMLSVEKIEQIAKETRFIQRVRNFNANDFLKCLFVNSFDNSKLSLDSISESLYEITKTPITKQALDLRFTEESVLFMKTVLEHALAEISEKNVGFNFLKTFSEVRIKDSTCFQLPDNMQDKYKGSGGAASKSSIRIQFEYDFKTGKIYDLSLHPFNKQDMTDAIDTINQVTENQLILRDLGYTCVESMQEIEKRKAFFISRLHCGTNVYESKNEKFKLIDFMQVYRYMRLYKITKLIKDVYISEKKYRVRMLIELLPENVAACKLAKITKDAQKNGRKISESNKTRVFLNLLITNIPTEKLDTSLIHDVYRLRWQIELIFKAWKGIGKVHKIKKMKIERFETYLYSRLLWLIVNWHIITRINHTLYRQNRLLLSFYKVYRYLKKHKMLWYEAIVVGKNMLIDFLNNLIEVSQRYQIRERRKDKATVYNILLMK